jgi:phosphoenolpyruvate carboxykinase (GTP)
LRWVKRYLTPPKIFNVNWFQTDENNRIIWPGFGDNLRVLQWIIGRCRSGTDAVGTPIGYLPRPGDISIEGLNDINMETLKSLLNIDNEAWKNEVAEQAAFLEKFDRLPTEIRKQYNALVKRLGL